MKATVLCFLGALLSVGTPGLNAAPENPAAVTNIASPQPAAPTDGVRPEDVMIDDDAIGDVWDTVAPADAIGITEENADIIPSITSGLSSAQMLEEQALLRPPRPEPAETNRIPTPRWTPVIPAQTLFYLGLAIVVVVVLLLKARG